MSLETKTHVVVLMGGMSSEHEVSMATGRKIAESLDPKLFAVTPVVITRNGHWAFPDAKPVGIFDAVPELKRREVDCVFIALHGPFGEDGRIQGMLDLLGLPYTCSGCAASALAMDKLRSKAVVHDAGIRTPADLAVERLEWQACPEAVVARAAAEIGFPCVVKSPCQGSSIGMAIAQDEQAFRECLPQVFRYGDELMVEAFISGTEVTCAVLDVSAESPPRALPLTEIRPWSASFFDYEAKYTPGAAEEITPAKISAERTAEVQEMSVRVHRLIGCGIWSRSDFIIDADGPAWLEVNTVPGMTPTSLYPQAAAAVGISYGALLTLFVEAAMAETRGKRDGNHVHQDARAG